VKRTFLALLVLSASTLFALPIDCTDNQVCTGTVCVRQQVTYYCDNIQYACDNDTQNYAGGNQICCTNKTACFTCTRTVNGQLRTYTIFNYTGMGGACFPN
jgi:hypothetical protein